MKATFALSAIAAAVSAIDVGELEFVKYMAKYQKVYHNMTEFAKRMRLF